MKSVHKESGEIVDRTFTCDNCGKRFANKENLGVHNRAVHKKSEHFLFCTICNKKFLTRIQLQTHTAKLHKKFACDLCQKDYKSKAALKKHMKKHNEEYIEKDPLVSDIAEACDSTPMILM